MASLRQIRGRLRSIQSTKQIMRAMQLVSASKLKRAQGKLMQARGVLGFLDELLRRLLAAAPEPDHPATQTRRAQARWQDHPLTKPREGADTLVVCTSDTGLCGSYNTNLIQLAESHLARDTAQRTQLVFIGKKGYRYFTKRGTQAADAYLDLAGRTDLKRAETIGRALMERFLSGQAGSIKLLYSTFHASMVYRPAVRQWLPVTITPSEAPPPASAPAGEYIFEPSPQRIFDDLLPRWALATFQLALLEAFTSEHSARMIAMKNATDNAEEIVKALTRQRNKTRQAAITREISEIVGTAEALK